MTQTKNPTVDDAQFWEYLYATGKTPWDLGKPAPPLVSFMKSPYAPSTGRVAVLGCGNGHECALFARHGMEVTGIDFSPSAIQATVKRLNDEGFLGTRGFLLERDFFDVHDYDGYYDYVVEHCCFCALHPSKRRTYAWTVRDLLRPGGKLIALWWLVPSRQSGPPFAVDKNDVFALFQDHFSIDLAFTPVDSVPERRGQELLTVMTVLK